MSQRWPSIIDDTDNCVIIGVWYAIVFYVNMVIYTYVPKATTTRGCALTFSGGAAYGSLNLQWPHMLTPESSKNRLRKVSYNY